MPTCWNPTGRSARDGRRRSTPTCAARANSRRHDRQDFHMAKNTTFSLGEQPALQLLDKRQARLSALRAALVEGENSGPSTAFDFDRFIDCKRKIGSSTG